MHVTICNSERSEYGLTMGGHPHYMRHGPTTALSVYRMVGNVGGKIFGRLLKICYLAEFTLAVEPVFNIHNKMANRTHWEFNRAVS